MELTERRRHPVLRNLFRGSFVAFAGLFTFSFVKWSAPAAYAGTAHIIAVMFAICVMAVVALVVAVILSDRD